MQGYPAASFLRGIGYKYITIKIRCIMFYNELELRFTDTSLFAKAKDKNGIEKRSMFATAAEEVKLDIIDGAGKIKVWVDGEMLGVFSICTTINEVTRRFSFTTYKHMSVLQTKQDLRIGKPGKDFGMSKFYDFEYIKRNGCLVYRLLVEVYYTEEVTADNFIREKFGCIL